MDAAIKFLANNPSGLATRFDEINYVQALAYAEEYGTIELDMSQILDSNANQNYKTFLIEIDGSIYEVDLNKEPEGDGALLNAINVDWAVKLLKIIYVNELKFKDKREKLLSLERINFRGGELKSIPSEFKLLKKLETLCLDCNNFTEVPIEIQSLTNLNFLTLAMNNISKLPSFLYDLKNLDVLSLGYNPINEIPRGIGELNKLTVLSLCRTPIKTLPEDIVNLTKLEILELSDMPNLVLSPNQIAWISKLKENGCLVGLGNQEVEEPFLHCMW